MTNLTHGTLTENILNRPNENFYQLLQQILNEPKTDDQSLKALRECVQNLGFLTPFSHIEGYRKLTAIILTSKIRSELKEQLQPIYQQLSESLAKVPSWKEFQLLTAYQTLCAYLENGDGVNKLKPIQLDSGFAPIEYGHHWTWGEVPLQPYHIELGVIWAVLGSTSKQPHLLEAADRLANFQMNLLDNDCHPLQGVFARECDSKIGELLGWSVSLFRRVGITQNKQEFISIADTQASQLIVCNFPAHPMVPILDRWMPYGKSIGNSRKAVFDKNFTEQKLSLVGYRNDQFSTVSTLYGAGTGLGSFQVNKNLSIVTFGPQHHPYGDCQEFGVDSSEFAQNKFPSLTIKQYNNGYFIKGYTKVSGKNRYNSPYSITGNSEHSEIWLDMSQETNDGLIKITIDYLKYQTTTPLAFVFYVSAKLCEIESGEAVHPKSLDRYQGKVSELTFSDDTQKITLTPHFKEGEMEIIPLAGDESFWGCDYLVGFSLGGELLRQEWQVKVNVSL